MRFPQTRKRAPFFLTARFFEAKAFHRLKSSFRRVSAARENGGIFLRPLVRGFAAKTLEASEKQVWIACERRRQEPYGTPSSGKSARLSPESATSAWGHVDEKNLAFIVGTALLSLSPLFAADPIFNAIKNGDIQEMNRLIDENPSCVNAVKRQDPYGKAAGIRALEYAMESGDVETVRGLVERGADLRTTDADGSCPAENLIECVRLRENWNEECRETGKLRRMRSYVVRASDPNRNPVPLEDVWKDKDFVISVGLAALPESSSLYAVECVLDLGVPVDWKDAEGRTLDQIFASNLQEDKSTQRVLKKILNEQRESK